jgi:hypothetical protein
MRVELFLANIAGPHSLDSQLKLRWLLSGRSAKEERREIASRLEACPLKLGKKVDPGQQVIRNVKDHNVIIIASPPQVESSLLGVEVHIDLKVMKAKTRTHAFGMFLIVVDEQHRCRSTPFSVRGRISRVIAPRSGQWSA